MEKDTEHITVLVSSEQFDYFRNLARGLGFDPEFIKPGPSRKRGLVFDRTKVFARFVRNGEARGKKA
jgi:hypothetical protein